MNKMKMNITDHDREILEKLGWYVAPETPAYKYMDSTSVLVHKDMPEDGDTIEYTISNSESPYESICELLWILQEWFLTKIEETADEINQMSDEIGRMRELCNALRAAYSAA